MQEIDAASGGRNRRVQEHDGAAEIGRLARWPAAQGTEAAVIPERDLLRNGGRDISHRRNQPRGQRLGCRPALARQRCVDKAVLDREVPLDRQLLRRDKVSLTGAGAEDAILVKNGALMAIPKHAPIGPTQGFAGIFPQTREMGANRSTRQSLA